MLCIFCYVCKDSLTNTYIKHVDSSLFWLLKTLLQMNSNSLVIKQKQKQIQHIMKMGPKNFVP